MQNSNLISGDGKTREARISITRDSAQTVIGRLVARPTPDEREKISRNPVVLNGADYGFRVLEFKLHGSARAQAGHGGERRVKGGL
jgi:hypothetical protein